MSSLKLEEHIETPRNLDIIMPYERNSGFTGRERFLNLLRTKLLSLDPKQYNHRVALYGMGGIGKTQIAVEYTYRYRERYGRVYWLSAVNRASLMSGFRKIAQSAGIPHTKISNPEDIAELVLSWLRLERSWLVVFDNLDDITVADRFLPETKEGKHTLITTRNPNSRGIPAEGLEVPLLDHSDSLELLSTLSNLPILFNSAGETSSDETDAANVIVAKLGYLPLAIEQAASFVREVTGSFVEFLKTYEKNHRDIHRWLPQGNRQYPASVATTWSLSFLAVTSEETQAGKLLQLFSCLNPDGILLDFLVGLGLGFQTALD